MNQAIPAASTSATATSPKQLEKAEDDKGTVSTISNDSSEQQKDNEKMNNSVKSRSDDDETEDEVEDMKQEMSSQLEANANASLKTGGGELGGVGVGGQSQTEARRSETVSMMAKNNNFAIGNKVQQESSSINSSLNNSVNNSMAMNNNMNMNNSMNMNNNNMSNNSTSDLLRSKLAAAAASAGNNQIDLELLRNMVQARAAATMGGDKNSHDLMNTAASAFSGGIDPSILSKALGLGNVNVGNNSLNQNLFGANPNNNQGLSQGLSQGLGLNQGLLQQQAQLQSLQQDKTSRSQSRQSYDNNSSNMNTNKNSNQNQSQHMSNSIQKEVASRSSSLGLSNVSNGIGNSNSNSMESQSKDMAANLLGLQQGIGLQQNMGIGNGNHASTLQALKDAAANLSSQGQNQNSQSDVKMEDSQQQQLQQLQQKQNISSSANASITSNQMNGNNMNLNVSGPANLSDLNQGLSLTPALMSLLQKAQGVGGQNSSYMEALQQLVKQQQQSQQLQLPPNLSSLGGDTSVSVNSMNVNSAVPGGLNVNNIGNSMHLPTAAVNTVLPPPSFPKNEMSTAPPSPGSSGGGGLPNGDNGINGNASDSNMGDAYRDYSKMSSSGANDFNKSQPPGKEPPFPVKLHRILSNPEYNDIVSWLPHGRSWRVLKPKAFEEKVIPLYFRHAKYASFMRQVSLSVCLEYFEYVLFVFATAKILTCIVFVFAGQWMGI